MSSIYSRGKPLVQSYRSLHEVKMEGVETHCLKPATNIVLVTKRVTMQEIIGANITETPHMKNVLPENI